MSILTPFFHLLKLVKGDPYDIQQFNANMDIIDTEMHRPPLTVNNIQPDPTSRNIQITTVPLADNLTSDQMQTNTGIYIVRSAGGDASISDGSAVLSDILGHMVKTGYVPESIVPAVVTGDLEISVDRDTFVEAVSTSQTLTFTYTTDWSSDPATYGITVDGTPASGDQFTVAYVKEDRGTITAATPAMFISTGWNLFNYSTGYARVTDYSQDYGFMIAGTYSTIKFAETMSGEKTTITPVNGFFTLPAGATDGYIFITGGNTTDTMLWMTWSDWEEEPNEGVFQPYSQTSIDLTGVMVSFPYGLMKVGTYADEINLNTQKAYSRIERLAYTEENLADVIAMGLPYDTDENYIFAVRQNPVVYDIEVSGNYTVSDHGEEYFTGTSVPVEATSFYGNDLKSKLRRNVLTISQQELTDAQKAQVLQNIGAAPFDAIPGITLKNNTTALADNVSMPNNTEKTIASFEIGKGLQIIVISVSWASNSNGYREFWVSTTDSGSHINLGSHIAGPASNGTGTRQQLVILRNVTETSETLYIRGEQNSGSSINASARLARIEIS